MKINKRLVHATIIATGLLFLWQLIVWITNPATYILPGPGRVLLALHDHAQSILANATVTLIEILLGLCLGTLLGVASALILAQSRAMQSWLMPVLVASQAIPVFAIAPVLVLWLGYGMGSKVAMATLIIFFPVTANFYDGLRRTDPRWLELAKTMNAGPLATLWRIRIPAALPGLSSGVRVATAVAPIGAIVGEWVGSSAGLGYLMLHANGRMQTDLMFAALFVLAVMAVALYALVDALLRKAVRWQPDQI